MSEQESVWQRVEQRRPDITNPPNCEYLGVDGRDWCDSPAVWEKRDHELHCATKGDRWNGVCYVCDTHKVEPQPPPYADWLAQVAP